MKESIRNYLGVAIIMALLVLAYGIVVYATAFSRSIEPSSFRSFSVTAEGKVVAVPDVARLTFSVITKGDADLAALRTANTEKANNAIAFVKEQGVEDGDIRTERFDITPRYQRFSCPNGFLLTGGESRPCPPPEIVGYTITQAVEVKVRVFGAIGDILAGVVENGANTVSRLSFTIDDPAEVESEARAEAIKRAREKADQVAHAGGFRVGRLLSISEGGARPFFSSRFEAASADSSGVGGAAPAPSIEPGSEEVRVTVTMTYEIR